MSEEYENSVQLKTYSSVKNMIYVMRETWKIQPILLPYMIGMTIFEVIMSFISLYVTKLTIQAVTEGNSWQNLFVIIVAVSIFSLVVSSGSTILNNFVVWRYTYVANEFKTRLLKKKMTMDFCNLEKPDVLDIAGRAETAAAQSMQEMIGTTITTIIKIAKIITSAAFILTINPFVVLILTVLILCHYLLIGHTKKMDKLKTWDVMAPKWRRIGYLDSIVADFYYGKDIRIFGLKDWVCEKQQEAHKDAHSVISKSKDRWMRTNTLNQLIQMLQDIALYAWLLFEVLAKGMSIADYSFYMGIVATFSANVRSFLDSFSDIRILNMKINDYRTFMELEEEPEKSREIPKTDSYEFTFEDVSFTYPGQEYPALTNLNMTIRFGEKLAIVGMNGAGKTTMIKLLMRLYRPTTGRILLNGVDVWEYDKRQYFDLFAPVFQDIERYAFSISENISFESDGESDLARVEQAAKTAGIWNRIASLPNKLATPMLKIFSPDGTDFSGGERQKLAIARALYRETPVLVLDEPTAALDPIAEYEVYQQFNTMAENKTAIFISHRLASTRFCDRILMFEGGQLIESGTHEELLAQNGRYAFAFQIQAQYYQAPGNFEVGREA